MKKVIYVFGAMAALVCSASGQETQDPRLDIKTDTAELVAAGPASATRATDDIWAMDRSDDTAANNSGNSPIPFPDIGTGGGGGKVKIPGKNYPDGPIDGGGDYGIAGIGGFKQLTDGGQLISKGSSKVTFEGEPVALAGSLGSRNEAEDEPEEDDED